jgi:FkbH-like protein
LRALKAKGVVLAVNSKNDPANVDWREGTLGDEDFVCAAISWEPKVHGMQRIQGALNLKIKDYVFVDDRSDERELMHLSYPDTLCLDATDARTWKRIALWGHLLENDPDMDRTLMYKQREARKAFIREDASAPEERARLFQSLGLRLTLQQAKSHDLKRVAELINRTNQFNLEGSRTTFREVSVWHESPDHLILLGQTEDRFGDMGVTCVAVVAFSATEMRILPFVLSCRVFGYGIERGVMNHLKQIAQQRGVRRIVGRYQETPQNAPCKDFLADNGFVLQDGLWSIDIDSAPLPSPSWLTISIV